MSARSYFIGGILICAAGAICFSTKAILVKLAYRDTGIEAVPLLALRMIFSLPFFLISAMYSSRRVDNKKFTASQWAIVALTGILGYYVSSLLDFIGLQYVSAGIERLILFLYPTMVLLISSIVFRTSISSMQWIAVAISYAGIAMAFAGEIELTSNHDANFYFGAGAIFACAITYAIYIIVSGKVIPIVGAAKYNSYAMTFACIAVLIHYFALNRQSLLNFPTEVYVYSILMAIISTVIPSYFISEGIRRIGGGNAAIVGSIGPISTIIQANIFLHEPFVAVQIFGTVLVLIGVLSISRSAKKDQ